MTIPLTLRVSSISTDFPRYNEFYIDWAKAVQGNEVAAKLKRDLENGVQIDKALENPYTIIKLNDKVLLGS